MSTLRLGLVGEFSPEVVAHRAIPLALGRASEVVGRRVEFVWLPTDTLVGSIAFAEEYDGLWCVPGSPFASFEGALNAIKYARESGTPFLGTCGGFQHALIEYARNVLGVKDADHAESNPDASVLFITPLTCALRGVKGTVKLKPGSLAVRIYGKEEALEEYNCGFGLNPEYRELIDQSGLKITGVDTDGEARVIELAEHPFFLGTLYQPERAAIEGVIHPLITAFVQAMLDTKEGRLSIVHMPTSQHA
jgi:CTP synthase (UTP-ammonia lyase)